MKAVKSRVVKVLPIGAEVLVADNSGANLVKIISVKGYKTRTGKLACAGVADLVIATVKEGKPEMKHKVIPVVIVRQKKEFSRADGTHVKFEDNAAVVLEDVKFGKPKGTAIKGPISREVAIRWPQIAKIASAVV